jgi:putative ABC transport system permease protein
VKFLPLVWSNLKRKKLRTGLTLLSILVAFLLFGFLSAIREAFTSGVSMAGADRLIVRHRVSLIQPLPLSYLSRIASVAGVADVAHSSWFGGIYQDPKNFFPTIPVEPESFMRLYPEFKISDADVQAWLKTRNGAIVGKTTMDRFKWKVGDRIPITSPIWGEPEGQAQWEFEIVGIFEGAKKNTDTSQFFFRYDYFDEARPRGKGQVGWYTVRIHDPAQAAEVAQRIDNEFANSPSETKAEPEGAFAAAFAQQIGDIGTLLMAVLSAVFFTILLVSGNTMGQAVRERTEELGVLKAMGFTNELVLTLVLIESILIAAIGGFAGLGIAWLLMLGGSPVPAVLPVLYLPGKDLVIGVAIIFILGVITGVIPAVQAMRLHIAEALRRNG